MGYTKSRGGRVKYFDAKNGGIRTKGEDGGFEDIESVDGYITGIRIRISEFEGERHESLQIRLEDPDPDVPTMVLSMTLWSNGDRATTAAWMLLARLTNPDNGISRSRPVVISGYGVATEGKARKVTCIAVRLHEDGPTVPGLKGLEKHREHIIRAISRATKMFGNFEQPSRIPDDAVPATEVAAVESESVSQQPPPPADPPVPESERGDAYEGEYRHPDDGLPF